MATARRGSARPSSGSSGSSRGSSSRGGGTSNGYRGAAAMRAYEEEQERSAQAAEARKNSSGAPFRFFCKPDGEPREYIIVDEAPDFCRFEHALMNRSSNRYDLFTQCINDTSNCPACKVAERPSYFAMYLTIIDLTGYENRDGDWVDWSKKLLVIKPQQQKKFMRLYERHGTLRGMRISATRDGERDAAIGNEIEFIDFVDEADLETYVTTYIDKEDKEHEIIGYEPFDYDELFPAQTEQQIRALVGGKASAGSREDDDNELNRGGSRGRADSRRSSSRDRDDRDDDRRPRGRGGREGWDDENADDDRQDRGRSRATRRGGDEDEDRGSRSRPARSASRREPQDDDRNDDQREPQDDDPPPERGTRRAARRGADEGGDEPTSTRRQAPRRREPEAADDDPPQRSASRRAPPPDDDVPPARASSMADRRRALRRN